MALYGRGRRRGPLLDSVARPLLPWTWWWGAPGRTRRERRTEMQRMMRPAALALAGLCALVLAARAQQAQAPQPQPQERFGERVEVREVLIDALVTDARGNVIVGLDKGDFEVRENGKPVNLTGVTFYSNRRLLEGSSVVAKKGIRIDQIPEDRYFILFFQDQKANALDAPQLLQQQIEAGRRARSWVAKDLLPNDWVAVASYDYKLKIHQDFTHGREDLQRAIDDAVQGKDTENNWPSRISSQGNPSLIAGLPRGNELRDRTATIYDGIRLLAEAAGKITGRKNLMLFTNGFGRIETFGQYVPDPRYYPPMVKALNNNNVAVYAIDLVPIGTQHTLSDAMNQLASDTGGRYYYDVVNFETPLQQAAKENSGYYLLSYRAEHPAGQSGFQPVQVRTTNPELKVRARKGYYYGP
jgi:VWFA-related protein